MTDVFPEFLAIDYTNCEKTESQEIPTAGTDKWLPQNVYSDEPPKQPRRLDVDEVIRQLTDGLRIAEQDAVIREACQRAASQAEAGAQVDIPTDAILTEAQVRAVIRYAAVGMHPQSIGQLLGVTARRVNKILSSPEAKLVMHTYFAHADVCTQEAVRDMQSMATQSTAVLRELLQQGHDDKVRLAAAKDILDRIGLSGAQKVITAKLSNDDLLELKRRAAERRALRAAQQHEIVTAVVSADSSSQAATQ